MTTMHASTNQPKEAAYIVYLNGIEIPAVSVTVTMGVDQLPQANITVAPDLSMVQLGKEDRVEVQVFYKDDVHSAVEGKVPDFRLLFDGVISGWSYINAARSRNIQFTCTHVSEILTSLQPHFITGPNSMAMNAYAAPEGSEANFLHGGPTFPWSMYFYGFNTPEQKTLIKRPYDLIENVFRSCIGINEAPQLGSVVTSVFYSRYMRKFNLNLRFIPSPIIEIEPLSDPDALGAFPILKAVRSKATIDALYRKTAETGVGGSMWDSLTGIFHQMYYEILTFPTAPIAMVEMTPRSDARGKVLGPPEWSQESRKEQSRIEETLVKEKFAYYKKLFEDELRAELALEGVHLLDEEFGPMSQEYSTLSDIDGTSLPMEDFNAEVNKRLRKAQNNIIAEALGNQPLNPMRPNFLINHVTKPQWLFGVPPACNVIFPSMITNLSYSESYSHQPTRLYVNDMSVPETAGINSELKKAQSTIRYAYPEQVEYEIGKRQGGLGGSGGNPLISGKNLLVWPEEFYRGPVSFQTTPPGWLLYLQENLQSGQTVEQQLAQKALDQIEQSIANIWSEAYGQAYQASAPPTTDRLFTNREEQSEADEDIRKKINDEMLGKLLDRESVLIKTLKEQKLLDDTVTSVDDLKEQLASRAFQTKAKLQTIMRMLARYEYHRMRSGARQGSVTMTFNPYIVPGFPAVIFDYFTHGQHFIGYVTNVTHEMSSRGWVTKAQFVHGQTIDEFANEVFDARVGNNTDRVLEDVSAGPPTPIPSLRPVMQHIEKAEEYFSQLFHQAADYTKGSKTKRAAFDFEKAFLFIVPGKTKDFFYSFDDVMDTQAKELQAKRLEQEKADDKEIEEKLEVRLAVTEYNIRNHADRMTFVEGMTKETYIEEEMKRAEVDMRILLSEMQYEKKVKREFTEPKKKLKNKVLDNYVGIRPTKSFAGMFRNHDIAMQYISRPICTLDEYISFRGDHGRRRSTVSPDHPTQGKGAKFYEQILALTPDDGSPPTFDENNFLVDPKPKDLPDTRKDWNVRLKNYRAKILFGTLPSNEEE